VYAAQLIWPATQAFPNSDTAFTFVAGRAWGPLFAIVGFTLLVANFGSGMGAQIGAARLLYGMGRSKALPQSFFGVVDAKRHVPRNNVIFVGVIALVGAFLFLLPALALLVVFYVRTSLAPPAIVLENLSGWGGLVRSWRLVQGLSWRIFGIRMLIALITAIISAVLGGLLTLVATGMDANGRLIVQQVVNAFTGVFIGPITYIAVTLLYYDTRIRKEGFDIEMLAQSL